MATIRKFKHKLASWAWGGMPVTPALKRQDRRILRYTWQVCPQTKTKWVGKAISYPVTKAGIYLTQLPSYLKNTLWVRWESGSLFWLEKITRSSVFKELTRSEVHIINPRVSKLLLGLQVSLLRIGHQEKRFPSGVSHSSVSIKNIALGTGWTPIAQTEEDLPRTNTGRHLFTRSSEYLCSEVST